MDLVTVATYPDLAEAELAKERLGNEGVTAFVLHENTAGIMPFLNGGAGGIHVQVAERDGPRAKEILGS